MSTRERAEPFSHAASVFKKARNERARLSFFFHELPGNSWKKNDKRARSFRAFLKTEAAWLNGSALSRVLIDENEGTERWDLWPEGQRSFAQAQTWLGMQKPALRNHIERQVRLV